MITGKLINVVQRFNQGTSRVSLSSQRAGDFGGKAAPAEGGRSKACSQGPGMPEVPVTQVLQDWANHNALTYG